MKSKFSNIEALKFGTLTIIEHVGFFIKLILCYLLCLSIPLLLSAKLLLGTDFKYFSFTRSVISTLFIYPVQPLHGILLLGISFLSSLLYIWLSLGATRIALDFYDIQSARVTTLFSCWHLVVRGLCAQFLYIFIIIIGFCLLIIPGIYWSIKYGFYQYTLVDKNCGIWQSFRISSEITQDSKWHLFGLAIVMAIINALGSLCFGIGLLFTLPLSTLVYAYVYRRLLALPVVKE